MLGLVKPLKQLKVWGAGRYRGQKTRIRIRTVTLSYHINAVSDQH
jgi:hypothetical protein